MKTLLIITMGLFWSCDQTGTTTYDQVPIEREEEYSRQDIIERESIPSETTTDDEIQLDREIIDEEELELDQ